MKGTSRKTELLCFHCGEECDDDGISINEKIFCCNGCLAVYRILSENKLSNYYCLTENPGVSQKSKETHREFAFLDDPEVKQRFTRYSNKGITHVEFQIPRIHCSSCIFLLENLYKINAGIVESKADFVRKKLSVTFRDTEISLREVSELIDSLGYAPDLSYDTTASKHRDVGFKILLLKTGVAGFAFANIMLFSFPDYLSVVTRLDPEYRSFFGYFSLLLSLPVFFYSSSEFFKTAWGSLRSKQIHLDFPISLGILVLFGRSVYEILSATGTGYLDSMTGLVFFLLVGRIVQNKTYRSLTFDRDYKSYFPLHTLRKSSSQPEQIPLHKLQVGERIIVRNSELVVADSILISESAAIDYSFVTGESTPVAVASGDLVYAGGKQIGAAVELETIKSPSESYLVSLWSKMEQSKSSKHSVSRLSQEIARYFTIGITFIAAATFIYWVKIDLRTAINAATAALIVACPCALALAIPFTYGTIMDELGKRKLFLKHSSVVEHLASLNTIVFDKTGTLTQPSQNEVEYEGELLTPLERVAVRSIAMQSTHPLSQKIARSLQCETTYKVEQFQELPGKGITGVVNGVSIRLGSRKWLTGNATQSESRGSQVAVEVAGVSKGSYTTRAAYNDDFRYAVKGLASRYKLYLLSGDTPDEAAVLSEWFGDSQHLRFNQLPHEKLEFVEELRKGGSKVMMIGDGLNDSGALSVSNVGIAVSDDTSTFSPACDAIMNSKNISHLNEILAVARNGVSIVKVCLVLSLLYNAVGLYFAVTGVLTPLISAILMPISSISIVAVAVLSAKLVSKKVTRVT